MKTSRLFFALLLAMLAMTGAAHAWWNSEWTLRKKITLDTSSIAAPIGTTPVLIRLHDGNFQFSAAKDDGSDIRFIASDEKTLLRYHIEKYDSLLNEAFVWVNLPDVKPGTKAVFWLYYGNGGPTAVKTDDARNTFDADTVLVYHFNEHGTPPVDTTASANNAQNSGSPADGSMIGSGLRFDGKTSVTIPNSPSLEWAPGASLTWSAWIKLAALKPNTVIYSRQDGADAFAIGVDNGVPYVEAAGRRSSGGAPVAAGTWQHLAIVAEGAKITLYLNGEPYGALDAALPAQNAPAQLGTFGGELDELEISKVARSPGFIKFAAVNQSGGDKEKLLTLGDDEQTSSWMSTGYVGIILKSLTLDGWIVIGILAMMSAVSWFVMFSKLAYLNGISKGNANFMKEWRHVAADLTVLDHGDADKVKTLGGRVSPKAQKQMRKASVYRIYHIGAEEIRRRLAMDPWGGGVRFLSVRSIQAIRASLDGGLVRESQKLNSLMVFLTISISGGPFLGLLGTVVGVMITFAAIAAAGDVNVNAIAPGIAAALVATVAGLAVAIPALFGYNYLLGRIKDATSDIHVFIDEFVTKMAEFYGGSAFSTEESSNTPYASSGR